MWLCAEMVLDHMIASGQLKEEDREDIMEILLAKHRHQHQKKRDERGMSIVRSMQEIGRRASAKNLDPKGESVAFGCNLSTSSLSTRDAPSFLYSLYNFV